MPEGRRQATPISPPKTTADESEVPSGDFRTIDTRVKCAGADDSRST